jgi:hypothetical protein
VARYQVQTGTLTSTASDFRSGPDAGEPTNVHTFNIKTNPCDGTFTGTGSWGIGDLTVHETINGTIAGNTVTSFDSAYDAPYAGYTWHSNGTDSRGNAFTVTNALSVTNSATYGNHGDYVSNSTDPNRSDAAHSCIGMPIQSR